MGPDGRLPTKANGHYQSFGCILGPWVRAGPNLILPRELILVPVNRGELAKWVPILSRFNPSMVRFEGDIHGVDWPGWCPIAPKTKDAFKVWDRLQQVSFVGQAVLSCGEDLALYPSLQDNHSFVVEIRQEHYDKYANVPIAERNIRYMTVEDLCEELNSEPLESMYWDRTYDDEIVIKTMPGRGLWTEDE